MSAGIRTLEHLQDAIQKEFVWRRKELTRLKTMVISHNGGPDCDLFIRASVTLLYAHWEGFVKQACSFYLEYVARKKITHSELPDAFLAMAIGKIVRRAMESSKVEISLNVVNFFRSEISKASNLSFKSGVNTKSNLKSSVFREIVLSLGLNYSVFATKEKLIDEKLLANRNQIAHGEDCLVSYDEYIGLHDEILGIMQTLYNLIENAAMTEAYRVSPAANPPA
jgi:hypothetical protein